MTVKLILLAAMAMPLGAVQILDTLYLPDGTRANGRLSVTIVTATYSSTTTYATFKRDYQVVNGVVNITLEANSNLNPAGTLYRVEYFLSSGAPEIDYWSIPNGGPYTIRQVRGAVTPTPPGQFTINQLSTAGAQRGSLIIYGISPTGWGFLNPTTDAQCLITDSTQPRGWRMGACATGGTGLSLLNNLAPGTQFFATGTVGTAPNILSAASTHTFNFPLAITAGVTAGLISKAEFDTFNSKESVLNFSPPLSRGGNTIGISMASNSQDGYINSANWIDFNAKVGPTRLVSTTAPLSGGGSLAGDLTLSCPNCIVSTGGAAHQLAIINAPGSVSFRTVPNCLDTAGNHLNFDQSTDSITCGNSGGTGVGGGAFSALTTGTNNSGQVLTVGNTSSLTFSGTGIVNANRYNGNALIALGDLADLSGTYQLLSGKNVSNGYAGLSAANKLPFTQGQEVWGLVDMTDVTAKQGSSTIIAMATGSFSIGNVVTTDAGGNIVDGGSRELPLTFASPLTRATNAISLGIVPATLGGLGVNAGSLTGMVAMTAGGAYVATATDVPNLPASKITSGAIANAQGGFGTSIAGMSGVLRLASGVPSVVSGVPTDCVLVSGGSGTCGGGNGTNAPVPNGFTQFAAGATTVTITHGFGLAEPRSFVHQCIVGNVAMGYRVMESSLTSITSTQVTINFPTASDAGWCSLNGGSGGTGGSATGALGGGAVSQTFVTGSTTVTITDNLGTKEKIAQCFLGVDPNYTYMWGNTAVFNLNTTVVTFASSPSSGKCTVSSGGQAGAGGGVSSLTGTANEITASAATGAVTVALDATVNLTSKVLRLPNSNSRPGFCATGDIYFDTSATSGRRIYACESTNNWVLQGGAANGGLTSQSFTSQTSQPVTHNAGLASPYLVPYACIDSSNLPIIPASVSYATNAVTFGFSPAATGTCVVGTGGNGSGLTSQSFTSQTSQAVTHGAGLASPYMVPYACVNGSNLPIIPATVIYSTNAATFGFSPAQTGTCVVSVH